MGTNRFEIMAEIRSDSFFHDVMSLVIVFDSICLPTHAIMTH